MIRKLMLLLAILGLLAAIPAAAVADHSNPPASNTGKFQLGGTAEKAKDPENPKPTNHVIKVDTTGCDENDFACAVENAGTARRELHVQVGDLDGQLSLDYFIESGDCGGGSPRISLGIDTDGDGNIDGNIHGHVDPNSVGCPEADGQWASADLTDAEPRWETAQLGLGLGFVVPWDVARDAIQTTFPNHDVMHGLLVNDSGWRPASAGVSYYDDVTIGDRTLSGPSDVLGN